MVPIEFISGGTGFPLVASASTCIGASQPLHVISVELTGVLREIASPNIQAPSITSPTSESEVRLIVVHEELTPA
jgi:hypothetical protein